MKNSKRFLTLLIVFVSVLIFSMLTVSVAMASTVQTDTTTDKIIQIDTKYKQVPTYKVTWNGNGGKIGTKTTISTNIKKGAKIGKLPTPKRTGYKFTGWYTAKSGGTKITKNTKVTKNVAYYAQWTKITESSKLVGHWRMQLTQTSPWTGLINPVYYHLYFYADGKFQYFYVSGEGGASKTEGKYSLSNGKVIFTEMKYYGDPTTKNDRDAKISNLDKFEFNYPKYQYPKSVQWDAKMTSEYKLGSDNKGNYLQIKTPGNYNSYYTLQSADKFYFTTNNKLP